MPHIVRCDRGAVMKVHKRELEDEEVVTDDEEMLDE